MLLAPLVLGLGCRPAADRATAAPPAMEPVATLFTGLQLEVGFAHQYFKPHFAMDDPDRGRFWIVSFGLGGQVDLSAVVTH